MNANPTDPRDEEQTYLDGVVSAIDREIRGCGVSGEDLQDAFRKLETTDYNARNAVVSMFGSGKRKAMRLAETRRNPYFGRVDFDDLTEKTSERIYLGSTHIRHKGKDYVYDWRAPVGELFYQNYGGRTTYRAPIGIVQVSIKLRRRLTIKNSELVNVVDTFDGSDPDPSIADSLLAEMLKRSAGANMGQIVKSIQAEQDSVIRASGDIVIVQGPAGSGKTVVALHRAAYLLYQMRQSPDDRLHAQATASSMRVFSPNRVFSEYISHVLPDLQEDAIEQSVFEQYLLEQLYNQLRAEGAAGRYKVQRKDDHFESMLTASADEYDGMVAACRTKTAPALAGELQAFLAGEEAAIRLRLTEAFAETWRGREEGVPIFDDADLLARYDSRREEASLLERVADLLLFVEDEIYERSQHLKESRRMRLGRQDQFGLALSPAQERRLAEETEVLKTLLRSVTKVATGIKRKSVVDLYRVFWEQHPHAPGDIRDTTVAALSERRIAYEDIPALLCLAGYYRGFPKLDKTIHAIVDECQDYTPLHYEFLKQCLPRGCTMTVVGDLNQTVDETVSLGDYDALATIFPGRTKRLDLTRSYRSSLEITEFAGRILATGARIDNVRRTGRLPEIAGVDRPAGLPHAIARVVEDMQTRAYQQIAVICKTRGESHRFHAQLRPLVPATLLADDAAAIPHGVVVLSVAQAKGLEFDAVIVHDAGAALYSRPADRRLLYTACTRALHELVVCHSGELSGLVPVEEGLCVSLAAGTE